MARSTNGASQYESLRPQLNQSFAELDDGQLNYAMARRGLNADAMEGFFDDLGKFAAKAAPAILPVAGQVLGTVIGGPAGGAIGSQLGSLAGGAISSATGGSKPGAPAGGSSAAAQLLQTVTRPETLQALASMAMGLIGKPNVAVGGTSVPVSAFSNLLGTLAGRAEAEYSAALAQSEGTVPAYLQDYAGQTKGDPAIASDRAEALYELLGASEGFGESTQAESAEYGEALSEWEMEADAAEAIEMAEGYESEEA